MAIVKRRKRDGSFTFQVKVKDREGKWLPTSSFSVKHLAEIEQNRLKGSANKQLRISSSASVLSVSQYWNTWKVENRSAVAGGWKLSQDQMYRDYVEPVIGKMRVTDVGVPDIGRIINRAQELGRGPQTRKHIYSLVRKMFGDAVEYYEMIRTSPVRPKFHRPRVPRTERNFLTPEQTWTLLEVAKGHQYLGPPVWVQLLTGLRTEAMIALQWKAIQWDLNQILICRGWKKKIRKIEEFPKNENWEYVPLPAVLKAYLKELLANSKRGPLDFVCPNRDGTMLSYDTYIKALKTLCRKAGVQEITPHETRHSSTELYARAGASTEDLRRLLNHASSTTTMRYLHRTDDRIQAIAGELSFPNSFPNEGKGKIYSEESRAR